LSEREIVTFRGHQGIVTSTAFSSDGRLLATGSLDIKIWNLDSILNYLWLGLDFPYRVDDIKKLKKEVEKQTGFTLDAFTPMPLKRLTLGQD
jgi:WD40 repeat protein